MEILISIVNPRNGLGKTVNATEYTAQEIDRVIRIYTAAGFIVKITYKGLNNGN